MSEGYLNINNDDFQQGIAIIGMAGRFPGANNVSEFWNNLVQGKETIKWFTDEELADSELNFDELKNNPNYVKAKGILNEVELFDASFFGFSPRDAALLDPQHRIWLEIAWEALENSGYCPEKYKGAIGVYAGSFMSSYLMNNIFKDRNTIENFVRVRGGDAYQLMTGNDPAYLPTRTAYKLNLKGPAVNVQTACSTSLVAIAQACQSLFNYESDICIAGGICVALPQHTGYIYQEGAIPSIDGHCRPFDAKAKGTIFSNGAGAVILKRLDEAIAEHDNILAVIKGYGINNDGSLKVSFMAPSVEGQAQAIAMAQAMANVNPETITYIEAHGTATPMGDPIEIAALTKAFRSKTQAKQFCGIGSVKSNVGHLDAAAGVTGIIKTAMALKNKVIPPSLNYEQSNPAIDFPNSPFYVVNKLIPWESISPRRAGISSFGIGGTNAHVILEEAPEKELPEASRKWQLFPFSAKTKSALTTQLKNFGTFLLDNKDISLPDVSYTLKMGRQDMMYKALFVSDSAENAIQILQTENYPQIIKGQSELRNPQIVFMFPGQGAQYVNMARELYETEESFKTTIDYCVSILKSVANIDLKEIIFPTDENITKAEEKLNQTEYTQPALFVIEYAIANLWMSWGIHPTAMIGHSIGEYVAACITGVFSVEDALMIVTERGRLMQSMQAGAMRAIRLTPQEVQPYLNDEISIAAHNAPAVTIVSGTFAAIESFDRKIAEAGLESIKLKTSHAFHSSMMEPALEPFMRVLENVSMKAPEMPFISSLTGTWILPTEATNPKYWAQQLLKPILFSKGIEELLKDPGKLLLEVGPGTHLSASVKQQPDVLENHSLVSSLGHINEQLPAQRAMLTALGKLWINGVSIDWNTFYKDEIRCRVALPTYPFERKRYWIDAVKAGLAGIHLEEKGILEEKSEEAQQISNLSRKEQITESIRQILIKLSEIDSEAIANDSSFTEMGLESLFLTQFATALEKRFKVSVKFRQLSFEYPTINSLTDFLDREVSSELFEGKAEQGSKESPSKVNKLTNLALFQPKGNKIPFVMVHGEKANDFLPELLGPDQPYYGYFHQGSDGEKLKYTEVKDVTKHYLSELLMVRPKGPYIIGGYSFGGIIAYEMAVQLQQMGQEVVMLLMIDCMNPYYKGRIYKSDFYSKLKRYLLSPIYRTMEIKMKMLSAQFYILIKKPVPLSLRNFYILEKYMRAYLRYKPNSFNGNIVLFRATENNCDDHSLGWNQLVNGKVEVFDIEGDHLGIVNRPENAKIFAAITKQKILEVQSNYVAQAANIK